MRFVHGDVRNADDLTRLPPDRRARGVLGGAVGAGRERRRRHGLPGPHQPGRRFTASSWPGVTSAQVVFLSTSRVYPIDALQQLRHRGDADAFDLTPSSPAPASPSTASPRTSRSRRAHALRRDQARRRAADRRSTARRSACRAVDQPLRRDRRPVADGQRRAGRLRPLDARAPPARTAPLHRLRGPATGPRPAPRRRPGRPARRPARRPGSLGRRHVQRRRRSGARLSLLEATELCPARHRQRGRRHNEHGAPGTATSRSTSPTAAASTPTRTGARAAAPSRPLADIASAGRGS